MHVRSWLVMLVGSGLLATAVTAPAPAAAPPADANLALGRTASQSSDYPSPAAPAARAVDGNRDGGFWNGSLSHTNEQDQPWWQVDLEARRSIGRVAIYNRTDCCVGRLADFYVLVSNDPFASDSLDASRQQRGVTAYHVDRVAGNVEVPIGREGRYVRIQLAGHNPLALAEVEVYRGPVDVPKFRNLALGSRTTQSSVQDGGVPTRAQDNNSDGAWSHASLSHTKSEPNPWWEADLRSSQRVTSVRVFNRTDCCTDRLRDFYVLTSDKPFISTDLTRTLRQPGVSATRVRNIGTDKTIDVQRTARYVRIQSAVTAT